MFRQLVAAAGLLLSALLGSKSRQPSRTRRRIKIDAIPGAKATILVNQGHSHEPASGGPEHHGAPLLNCSGLVLVRQLIERLGVRALSTLGYECCGAASGTGNRIIS